jgi:predicted nucleic acid-binding Zn ribbon protein
LSRIIYSLRRGTPQHGQWVLACLEGSWPHIIGEIPAQACRPVDFRNSEVVIEILDSAWEKTLRNLRDHIEEKLRAATGDEVRAVRFTIRK